EVARDRTAGHDREVFACAQREEVGHVQGAVQSDPTGGVQLRKLSNSGKGEIGLAIDTEGKRPVHRHAADAWRELLCHRGRVRRNRPGAGYFLDLELESRRVHVAGQEIQGEKSGWLAKEGDCGALDGKRIGAKVCEGSVARPDQHDLVRAETG